MKMIHTSAVIIDTIQITTEDNAVLAANFFYTETQAKTVILINSATGVPRYFYVNFAKFLAEKGCLVYTYDYRDTSDSLYTELNKSNASYYEWGKFDFGAMIKYISNKHTTLPLQVIGHSFGGSCIGMSSFVTKISKIVTVCSPNMYWRNFPLTRIPTAYIGAKIAIPLFNKIYGYLPTEIKGLGTNLPKNVGKDWTRSILNKTSIPGLIPENESYYHKITAEILMLGFTDDWMASDKAIHELKSQVPNAKTTVRIINPKDEGINKVGHLNFFRKENADVLWKVVLNWLKT